VTPRFADGVLYKSLTLTPTNHESCLTPPTPLRPAPIPPAGWTVLSRGYDGWTPLIIAGYNGCPAVLRCLLAPSSSHPSSHSLLEGRDERGATALWWAAVHNRPEAVRVLLEAGADFLQANDEDKTALGRCSAARGGRERGREGGREGGRDGGA